MVRSLYPHLDCSIRLYDVVRCKESRFSQVLPLSQWMTLPSSLSDPMSILVPSLPKQALQFGLHAKDWKISQVSLTMVTMVLALVDHLPLKLGGLSGIVRIVVLLLSALVCCTTTKCISGSRVASSCSSFSFEGAYVHFGYDAGCAVVILRNLFAGGLGCAPAGCFLLYLLVKVISVCAGEGDCGSHVEALVRVTVLPSVFLRVFTIRSLLVVITSSRRVLVRWCRLLRCPCLSGSKFLRFLLPESSELADSVAVWGSSSSADFHRS